MSNPRPDDAINYLTNKENLPYTLDILRQSEEIRCRVLDDFWQSIMDELRGSVPKALRSQKLKWVLWPGAKKMHAGGAGVYFWPSQFSGQSQCIHYRVVSDGGQSLFDRGQSLYYGLSWEESAKPGLLKLLDVKRLIEHLSENGFRQTQWSLGYKYFDRRQDQEALLLNYAKDRDEVYRQIQETFWAFVKETFGMMMKANQAVRRAA
jgi:hypothetical protein